MWLAASPSARVPVARPSPYNLPGEVGDRGPRKDGDQHLWEYPLGKALLGLAMWRREKERWNLRRLGRRQGLICWDVRPLIGSKDVL